MASAEHQFILRLVVRKMRRHGAHIYFVDGRVTARYGEEVRTPPTVLRHKPDVLAITDSGQICIGDAKTQGDVGSKRTKEQLSDFVSLELNGMLCEVFIGVPCSARSRLEKVLLELGLSTNPRLHVTYVPREIINRA